MPTRGDKPAEGQAGEQAVPALDSLYFYLTGACNLACRHCWIAPTFVEDGKQASSLPLELFESIVAEARPLGLTSVKLTGGEPLLHPRFAAVLDVVRREGLGLTVETNGLLCTDEIAAAIARCGESPFVSVSLDGASAGVHERIRGVKGSFARTVAGIGALVRAGLRPQVIMTLQRGNVGEAGDLVSLARDLGAGSVKFNVMQPTARGARLHEAGEALAVGELIALGRRLEGAAGGAAGVKVFFDYPLAFRALGAIADDGCGSCGILGILGVLGTGEYALCGIGAQLPGLVFGTAGRDRLADVWAGHPVLRELRAGLPGRLGGVCARCLLRGACRGSCLAQTYYRTGSLWKPFWFCEEAERAGLFPETRLATARTVPAGPS